MKLKQDFRRWAGMAMVSATMLIPGAAAAAPVPPERAANAILAALIESNGVPGMGAALWQDGKLRWSGSAGFADLVQRRPVTAKTQFRFASVSKLFAVTAAAQLREQGRLDVNAPISTILPWLPPGWPPITTAQLAAHTAGIPHYQDVDSDLGSRHYGNVRDAAALVTGRTLLSPPGTAYSYSSWGFVLLSAVVEAAAGVPYLDVVANQLTSGLIIGPDATGPHNPDAATPYEFVDHVATPAKPHDYSYTWAGGGLSGTAPALAQFGGRVLQGGLVSPATLRWLATPALLADGKPVMERNNSVGFGWRHNQDLDGNDLLHHAGYAIGVRSALVLYPQHGTAVSLLSNAGWVASIEQTAQMLAAPFLPQPAVATAACPLNATTQKAWYGDAISAGTVRFTMQDGLCVGELPIPPALAARLDSLLQRRATKLSIVGIDAAGGLARAALITPIGASDLRPLGDGRYRAELTATSSIILKFDG
jgi:CubicO group peptidase (beta-lactamase class C family)